MDKIVFVCKSEFCQNRRDWKEAVENIPDFSINRRQTLQELKNYLSSNEHGAFFFLSRPVNTLAEAKNDDDKDIIVMPATSAAKPDMPAARSLKRRHEDDEDIIDWSDVSSSEPDVPTATSAEPEIDDDDIVIMPATTSSETDARQNTPPAHNKKKNQYQNWYVSKEERDAMNATVPVGAFQPKEIKKRNRRRK
ncbi:hypothetical protein BDV97DRAFT_32617 [Delphinella strobiligena]|nr:hypothetical protein BDV97DRAFT_32617 [Delphinella strobiligena]